MNQTTSTAKLFFIFSALFCLCASNCKAEIFEPDTSFKQAISVKYNLPELLKGSALKKVVVDYNDIIYILTDKGLYRVNDKDLVRDVRYTPLAEKIPVDVAVQEGEGNLYYLYKDKVLTNAQAGAFYKILPEKKYAMLAVAGDGSVLLAGDSVVSLCKNESLAHIPKPPGKLLSLYVYKGTFYALTGEAVYQLKAGRFIMLHKGLGLKTISFRKDEIILATAKGFYGISMLNGDSTFSLQTKVPVEDIDYLKTIDDNIWAATNDGAYMQEPTGKYRYYASKRWLDENKVTCIASDSKKNVYLLTPTGLNKIEFHSQTLLQKATYFEEKIRQRHIRYGFISNVTFTKRGDIATAKMTDTDNDGLWSAFYLGSQAFRYGVTRDKTAKRYAWETFEAFERILSVNPLKGFPARTFERRGFKHSDPERWHPSQDTEWEWKGTTSSDEFVGYIFAAAVLHELTAETATEKKRVADFIDKILGHIIRNNYQFIDADGKPTLWGRWNPEYINSIPSTVSDRKLGSTTIIAGLQLGYALTGKEIYKTEALRLMNEHGYLKNILVSYKNIKPTAGVIHLGVDIGSGNWNHSDDEMAFLTYWVLYKYAFNKELQQQYKQVIIDHWEIEKPERNALWNVITFGTTGTIDKESTLWHLREFPMDLMRWDVKNSHRKDIVLLPPNFRNQLTKDLLPPDETPIHRHNANAFELDGGEGGTSELAGDEYLLPYWMSRYLKVIE
ncbi:hypothetical protein [Segetibacter koreensis]|uniref:hypothetical protein n=1 Tax=Segetibacter koreensis TaxID=398037 RepID=UPI00037F917B|nr:hypothetical protein [Segetibacter koreensis]